MKQDKARSDVLESCGFLVVRVSNTDVYENLEGALEMIESSLRFDGEERPLTRLLRSRPLPDGER
jgi:very-short-patch-repair endonuclease